MSNLAPITPRLKQADRPPVSTYQEALARLVVLADKPGQTREAYADLVELVADLFWKTDVQVRRDMILLRRAV